MRMIGLLKFLIFPILSLAYTNKFRNFRRVNSINRSYSPFLEGSDNPLCRIKVIGVGGGGSNAINRIKQRFEGLPDVTFWVVNTDAQALSRSEITNRLNIGTSISR
jgi:cell division GTPase FtsZ